MARQLLFLIATIIYLTSVLGSRISTRIIGGKDASNENIPWQVSLTYFKNHFCGGSIINKQTIITAAHCVKGLNKKNLKVRVGSKFRTSGGTINTVKDIVIHNLYGIGHSQNNDIALLFLNDPLHYVKGEIEPICLTKPNKPIPVGSLAMISGWGSISAGTYKYPENLQFAFVKKINSDECNKQMSDEGYNITDTMLCAGYPNGGIDACKLDSGGPLVQETKLIGIISWGLGCAEANSPGVYTDVSKYIDWINDKIVEHNKSKI